MFQMKKDQFFLLLLLKYYRKVKQNMYICNFCVLVYFLGDRPKKPPTFIISGQNYEEDIQFELWKTTSKFIFSINSLVWFKIGYMPKICSKFFFFSFCAKGHRKLVTDVFISSFSFFLSVPKVTERKKERKISSFFSIVSLSFE